jgi:hypothetical protein
LISEIDAAPLSEELKRRWSYEIRKFYANDERPFSAAKTTKVARAVGEVSHSVPVNVCGTRIWRGSGGNDELARLREELEKTKQVSYKSKIQREPSRTNYETGFNLAAVILSIN